MGAPMEWTPAQDADALMRAVRDIAQGPLAELAPEIDRKGTYPEAILRQLGAVGALGLHHDPQVLGEPGRAQPDFGLAIRAMAEVSKVCGATGFMVWCHLVCGLYMEQSGNPHLAGPWLSGHARGEHLGGTGLSNPMKTFAGIERFLLKARRMSDGSYRVDGTLPWVSNIGPDHYFGAIASIVDDQGETADQIMFIARCDAPGVSLRPCPSFSAMEGTNTWAVRFEGARVDETTLVADPVRPFIGRIRGAFVLLQTGMGLGVAQGAIDSMWQVESALGHVNTYLEDRPDALQRELDDLSARIMQLARSPFATDTDTLIDILDVRAHAAELSLRAAQSALLHAGARGYLMSSDVQRRVRESHFVAIVTPAIKHLRKEIARLSQPVMPSPPAQVAGPAMASSPVLSA
jgi:alkylation response protein AidB-like acyl-CoA dehydrogenase